MRLRRLSSWKRISSPAESGFSHEAAFTKRITAEQGGEIFVDEEPSGCSCGPVADFGSGCPQLADKGIQPYLEIKAPLNGYVTNMNVNVGKYFNVGEPVCDVIDKQARCCSLHTERSG